MFSSFDVHTSTSSDMKPSTGAGTHLLPTQTTRLIRVCLLLNGERGSISGDPEIFRTWLNASLPQDTNVGFKLDPYWTQEQNYPTREEIDHYDAVVLSGSGSSALGDDPWISLLMMFVQTVANKHPRIRIFGICFGSHIVARALGGQIRPNPKGWEIGVTECQTTYIGKLLYGVEKLNLLLFHRDHVILNSLSDLFTTGDLYLIGNSLRTPCQGIVKFYPVNEEHEKLVYDEPIRRVHILTTQGHPEFTRETISSLLRRLHNLQGTVDDNGHKQYFGEKGYSSETERVFKQDTGMRWFKHYDGTKIVGRTFWRMLGVSYGSERSPQVPSQLHYAARM